MKQIPRRDALLLLEDGTLFRGVALGKIGTIGGELCFNTGMTGYQEIYTDPSYFGQIILNTASHIGNYGTLPDDQESANVQISGLVCNQFSAIYSRTNARHSLQEYFERFNIVGISEVDTRQIVMHIRSKGAMNALISSEIVEVKALRERLAEVPSMNGLELSTQVSTQQTYTLGDDQAQHKVAILDLGIKTSILKNLTERNVQCKVFPAKTSFQEMQTWQPDGYFVSNGPGDPAAMPYAVQTVKEIIDSQTPLFGICLGHQLLALASDVSTYKLHNGHRGLNHPVKNLVSGKSEITSQNHGFGVSAEDVQKSRKVEVTHVNLNDKSIEGIRLKNGRAFSVQYHPESSPGPHDSRYLFNEFVTLLKNK